jgi:hypothetical protein
MERIHLLNRTLNEVKALYCQGVISKKQWEAYDYLFRLLQPTDNAGLVYGLVKESREELYGMINALPLQLAKIARLRLINHYG